MAKRWRVALVLALLLSSPARGLAADEKSRETGTRWYGWQTLLVDTASVTAMIASVRASPSPGDGAFWLLWPTRLLGKGSEATAAIDGSLALYTLGPAFVHAVHGQGVPALLSPAVRAGAPTVGTVAGALMGLSAAVMIARLDGHERSLGGPALGALAVGVASGYVAGFVTPIVLDAAVLAREPATEGERAPTDPRDPNEAAKVKWSPRMGLSPHGPTVGLSGTF